MSWYYFLLSFFPWTTILKYWRFFPSDMHPSKNTQRKCILCFLRLYGTIIDQWHITNQWLFRITHLEQWCLPSCCNKKPVLCVRSLSDMGFRTQYSKTWLVVLRARRFLKRGDSLNLKIIVYKLSVLDLWTSKNCLSKKATWEQRLKRKQLLRSVGKHQQILFG